MTPPPLERNETENALQTFVGYSRCFSLREFMTWLDPETEQDKARQWLKDTLRFIGLGLSKSGDEYYIPEAALFTWWGYLMIRLAKGHEGRLSRRDLATEMTLGLGGSWIIPPETAVDFGRRFGFVSHMRTSDHYVFPLAHVLSYLPPSSINVVSKLLKSFADTETRDFALNQPLEWLVQQGLANFDKRIVEIISAREGLQQARKMTLEQIGVRLRLTRERVRQIEATFWKRLSTRRSAIIEPFLNAFLCDIIRRRGSLIVDVKCPDSSHRIFVSKCIGIPQLELRHFGLVLLVTSRGDLDMTTLSGWHTESVDETAIAGRLGAEGKLNLSDADLAVLAEHLARYRRKHLNKAQKAFIALRSIGRPAHYSEIAEVYSLLFPNDKSIEHNIHAILGRQQYGVVWIGSRGTYGLTEWGCERPSTTIFNAVAEIVKNRYLATGNSVPFVVIVAEMGKYRQAIHPTSLLFAAHFNPRLQRVTKDSFIPREPTDLSQEEITADELDRILSDFEETTVYLQNTSTDYTL